METGIARICPRNQLDGAHNAILRRQPQVRKSANWMQDGLPSRGCELLRTEELLYRRSPVAVTPAIDGRGASMLSRNRASDHPIDVGLFWPASMLPDSFDGWRFMR
jgi:hypothetical protein